MRPPLDVDPLTPEDWLWDPLERRFVPRRPTLIPMMLSALAGAIVTLLVVAAVTHAGPPSAPAPEPSFVPVPGATMSSGQRRAGEDERARASVDWVAPIMSQAAGATESVGSNPTAAATLVPRPTPRPKLAPVARGHVRSGVASWYADPRKSGLYAAAGPPLRVGDWRGRTVTVSAGGHSFRVVLSDWCACRDRVIDLSPAAFSRLADLSRGLTRVTVSW